MKAVSCKAATLAVIDRQQPKPGKGQLLIDVCAAASAARTCTPATTATSSPT